MFKATFEAMAAALGSSLTILAPKAFEATGLNSVFG